MHITTTTLLTAALSTLASAGAIPRALAPRWDTSICTAETSNVPVPDADNFQLPLENMRQDMCWDLCVGDDAACTLKTKVCYDFVGPNLVFDFKPVAGHTYTSGGIWLGSKTAEESPDTTPQFTTANGSCGIAVSTEDSHIHCSVPYSSIVGGSTLLEQLHNMCPYGDREGLVLNILTTAKLSPIAGGEVTANGRPSCTDYPACTSYYPNEAWVLTYRCTKCPVVDQTTSSAVPTTTDKPDITTYITETVYVTVDCTSTPVATDTCTSAPPTTITVTDVHPTTTEPTTVTITDEPTTTKPTSTPTYPPVPYCDFGTGFGYTSSSKTLNSLSPMPKTCNRWGWYTTPTISELQGGISGPLYVGAGGNDISKATDAGTWTAIVANGELKVVYDMKAGYAVAEAHVDFGCMPYASCAPGSYVFGTEDIAEGTALYTTAGIKVPSCGTRKLYLIVHASVDKVCEAR